MSDIQIILIAFAAIISTVLLVRIFSAQPKKGKRGQVTNIDDDLLRTCCGDQAMADRLGLIVRNINLGANIDPGALAESKVHNLRERLYTS